MTKHQNELADDSLEAMLKRAEAGDIIAAKQSLSWMADALASNAPIPKTIRVFLADVLWRISHNGIDANEALHIKVSHRPNIHDFVDLRRAAIRMRCYMEYRNEETGKLFTKKQAAKKAAIEYNESQARFFLLDKSHAPKLTRSAVELFYDEYSSEIDAEARKCFPGKIHKI